jgi:hypothetical protein
MISGSLCRHLKIAITKPGTSDFHGTFNFLLRDYHLNARDGRFVIEVFSPYQPDHLNLATHPFFLAVGRDQK